MQFIFALALLLSAILLFVVEPMFAKMVLPRLGGSPSVWNTCLVFYQFALLAGYLYAHLSVKWLGVRRQSVIHLILLCLPWIALMLPIAIPMGWAPPSDSNPIPSLLVLLTITVGLPFLCVSATAPLLQAWFAATGERGSDDPYFLYAASNVGSLLGLAAYPLVIESHLTLAQQSRWWAAGYTLFIAFIAMAAAALWVSRKRDRPAVVDLPDATPAEIVLDPAMRGRPTAALVEIPPTIGRRIWWLALALVPSSLLLGVTTHLSTDIAAIPLLWVIPLALYLFSFVIVFSRWNIGTNKFVIGLQAILLVVLAALLYFGGIHTSQVLANSVLHLTAFFVTALVCHGRLAADRPGTRYLTEFYLWMSLGGLAGGLFNALVAPVIFNSVLEYPLMLVAACLLRPWPREGNERFWKVYDLVFILNLAAVLAFAGFAFSSDRLTELAKGTTWANAARYTAAHRFYFVAAAGVIALFLQRRPDRFAVGLGAVLVVGMICADREDVIYRARSFFGVLQVERGTAEDKDVTYRTHRLLHGSTLHGEQAIDSDESTQPWTYYCRSGPVGDAFDEMEKRREFKKAGRIGVVGLGTGTVAAYGMPGQHITYFEIDAAVRKISTDRKFFTYVSDCRADLQIKMGDARLTMANEPDKSFDILLIDAFSSDAIPVHLITREAIELYFKKLDDRGLLMIHISNRHLDLEPVVGNAAQALGKVARVRNDDDEESPGKCASNWVVLTRSEAALGGLLSDTDWEAVHVNPKLRLWTDDFSNVLGVVTWDMDWSWVPGWKWWHRIRTDPK